MGGFIVGFDNDTPSIFQRQIDFIQKSGIVTAMVGMLQAPYGTKLYERMQKEGRLVDKMTGDNADGSTNIQPKMGSEILKEGYRKLMVDIYSPKRFYERVRIFLEEYNPPQATVSLHFEEIYAFFRSILRFGIFGSERTEYWKFFIWALTKYPKKFALAITFTIYGYHFRAVNEINEL